MTTETQNPLLAAQQVVEHLRKDGRLLELAQALETFAGIALKQAEVQHAAGALEEASRLWQDAGQMEQSGSCMLLAASSFRLANQPEDAKRLLDRARGIALPERLSRGFEVEACEQELAAGNAEHAWVSFSRFLERSAHSLTPPVLCQILQRRAAAALACKRSREAAADMLQASKLYLTGGQPADAEACALAAAGLLIEVDAAAAEHIFNEVSSTVPTDGAAATRRGLIGGRIALKTGSLAEALHRFDSARQGALDVGDPLSYFTAAVEAAHAAEALGKAETAYAQLARAWGSLSDLLGRETAKAMVQPELERLRDRLGAAAFDAAKQAYEAERRRTLGANPG